MRRFKFLFIFIIITLLVFLLFFFIFFSCFNFSLDPFLPARYNFHFEKKHLKAFEASRKGNVPIRVLVHSDCKTTLNFQKSFEQAKLCFNTSVCNNTSTTVKYLYVGISYIHQILSKPNDNIYYANLSFEIKPYFY